MLGYKPWYYLVRLHDLVNSCLLQIWKNIRASSIPLRGGPRAAATSKMECFVKVVNYYHKALHLGRCSSPRSASALCYFILDIVFIKYQPFQSNALSKIWQNRGFLWSVFSYIRTFFYSKKMCWGQDCSEPAVGSCSEIYCTSWKKSVQGSSSKRIACWSLQLY